MTERTLADRIDELERGFARVLEGSPPDEQIREAVSDQAVMVEGLWRVQVLMLGALVMLALGLLAVVLKVLR